MSDPSIDQAGSAAANAWSHEEVSKLLGFARTGTPAEDISFRLERPLAQIHAKARELGVVVKPRL